MIPSVTSRRLAQSAPVLRALVGNSASAVRPVSTASSFIRRKEQSQRCNSNSNAIRLVATHQSHYRRWFADSSSDDSTEKATTTATEEKETDAPADADVDSGTSEKAAEETPSETDKLKAELAEMKDQLLRSLAEQENIRSIARRDVETARNFSVKSFAKSLLDVADNLDRALESVDQEEVQANPTLKTFAEGIEMTGSGLVKALRSNGVEAFCETPGDEFDAEKHQALMEYVDPNATPGTVGTVMKKGYTLNGRVLRAAEVGIIKK
eukprot:CAMPEP_0172358466 /NCGR_PEP_ID=MMETSP1060-20121228/2783_1 /TAXON_ID=37318 /ORGANISM="Pseudo-nitzschia pungens, Strain cf. cingulata" /LENGTH=266 /DNA_ID=CAMNT_0013079697 /DNA_START=165 /DNA_END=965 /DNA_ORIENTATION=+